MPVGPYDTFDDCIAANQDKDDPAAFCAYLKAETAGTDEDAEEFSRPAVRVSTPQTRARGSFETIDEDEVVAMDLSEMLPEDEDRWEGVIAVEDTMTGDGRMFSVGAMRWETLPVPLRWTHEDHGEHLGAVVVGRIDEVYRDGKNIMGRGIFDLGSAEGREAARQVREGLTPGISVDLDDVSFEIRVAESALDESEVEIGPDGMATVMRVDSQDEVMVTTDARLRAATIVATPAFAEARIYMVDEEQRYAQQYAPVPEQDMFATPEEAIARAVELGCEGMHSMDVDGETVYMPCEEHEEYDELAGEVEDDADLSVFALSDQDRTPTGGMATEAKRAIDWRADGNSGGEDNTVQRARSIASRESLGVDTIRRMHNFFSRNASYPTMPGFSPGQDGYPSAARVAWGLWGGDAGKSWSSKLVDRLGREEGSVTAAAYQGQIRSGGFVRWSWSGGTAQGKVERVVREGSLNVPGSDTVINADPDNPAVLIESWREVNLESGTFYEPSGSMVGRRMDALTSIDALRERPASAQVKAATRPPSEWFRDPKLKGPTPLTVTEDGRVFGHLATWGTCHTGFVGECVQPPASASNYAYFRTGSVRTGDGVEVAVGRLTLDTTHAGRRLGATDTAAHYEHTGVCVADVAAGEDPHGIWVAGSTRPGVSDEQIRVLLASPLSGDWRRIGGQLELVAALAVNSPGFPIPRALVAGGNVLTLQASGVVSVAPVQVEELKGSEDDALLARMIERERVAVRDQRKQALSARNRLRAASAQARFRRVSGR